MINTISFEALPDIPLCKIFRKLDLADHFSVHLVCKNWNEVAKIDGIWKSHDLTKIFPDTKLWQDYPGISFEKKGRPCLKDKAMYFSIKKLIEAVENNQGISFVTIPKGLTINKLLAVANEHQIPVDVWGKITKHLGDVEVEKTVTVVLTKSVLKGTKFQSKYAQLQKLAVLGYEAPTVVAVMALALLNFVGTGEKLFGNDTITRCSDLCKGIPLGFGLFGDQGPKLRGYGFDFKEVGMAAMIELDVTEE